MVGEILECGLRKTAIITRDAPKGASITRKRGMANNLFISYESMDRAAVETAIKAISPVWARLETSLWWISTPFNLPTVRDRVWAVMQPTDKLVVIDTTTIPAAGIIWTPEAAEYLKTNWSR